MTYFFLISSSVLFVCMVLNRKHISHYVAHHFSNTLKHRQNSMKSSGVAFKSEMTDMEKANLLAHFGDLHIKRHLFIDKLIHLLALIVVLILIVEAFQL